MGRINSSYKSIFHSTEFNKYCARIRSKCGSLQKPRIVLDSGYKVQALGSYQGRGFRILKLSQFEVERCAKAT